MAAASAGVANPPRIEPSTTVINKVSGTKETNKSQ